jgi:Na+:H+ antiporter, NhaA family
MLAAVCALIWANSPWSASYVRLWQTQVSLAFGPLVIDKPLLLWINDGLMAVFFFLVGLEIKREILVGELASIRKATLPIVAAIGGMVVPALVFAAFNASGAGSRGWGIPMATDIAFALGVLSLLGPRVPIALKVFLAAVAIVDDIGAVLVIAIFYSEQIKWALVGAGFAILAGLLAINRMGVRNPAFYVIPGVALWVLFLKSGVHATVAGVLLAMTIPTRVHLVPADFEKEANDALEEFGKAGKGHDRAIMSEDQQAAVHALEEACERAQMPLQRIEHALHPVVSFFIMPLFALANAGLVIDSNAAGGLGQPVGLGVLVGLVVGKPVGILLASWMAVKAGVASLPSRVGWRQMLGVGVLAGIGFTMSLFINDLAFAHSAQASAAKLSILAASVIAGLAGYLLLRRSRPGVARG